MWGKVVPELDRMGLLGLVDVGILEAYCRTYSLWREHDGGRGYPTLTTTLVALGSKLGLDPAARLRMVLPEVKSDDRDFIYGSG
jgi:phage terminase small subunit